MLTAIPTFIEDCGSQSTIDEGFEYIWSCQESQIGLEDSYVDCTNDPDSLFGVA